MWALRRPPALGEAGDEEMSQAMQQTKLDNATLELHDKHNNDAHKEGSGSDKVPYLLVNRKF